MKIEISDVKGKPIGSWHTGNFFCRGCALSVGHARSCNDPECPSFKTGERHGHCIKCEGPIEIK